MILDFQNKIFIIFKKFLIFLIFQNFENLGMLHTTTLKRNLVPRFGEARKKDGFWISVFRQLGGLPPLKETFVGSENSQLWFKSIFLYYMNGRTTHTIIIAQYTDYVIQIILEQSLYWSFIGSRLLPHGDRKSTRLNSSHSGESRMPSSA